MLQVADEAVGGRFGKGEGVAPKVPLKGNDGKGCHTGPNQAEGRLSSSQAGVEEAEAGDHDDDHGRGHDDVGLIAGLIPLIQILRCCHLLVVLFFSTGRRLQQVVPESPPVASLVPLNSAGAPIQEYDMLPIDPRSEGGAKDSTDS